MVVGGLEVPMAMNRDQIEDDLEVIGHEVDCSSTLIEVDFDI